MAKLGKIPSETQLACPCCRTLILEFALESLAQGLPCRCPGCHQQLRVPQALADRLEKLLLSQSSRAEPILVEQMDCPACQSDLIPLTFEGSDLELDRCTSCVGLWFDRSELRQLITDSNLHGQIFEVPPQALAESVPTLGPRSCARCDGQALNVRHLGDVEVDECSSCRGVWLDAGELTRVLELHRARQDNQAVSEPLLESRPTPTTRPSLGILARALKSLVGG